MARIRSIKPEFFSSEQVAECSPIARLLFIGMWCFCDDGGVHPASPKALKMRVFPGDDLTADNVSTLVGELLKIGLLEAFEAENALYWRITGWSKHQKIDRPTFKYPQKSSNDRHQESEGSTSARRGLDERLPPEGKGVGEEGNGGESSKPPPPNPPADESASELEDPRAASSGDLFPMQANWRPSDHLPTIARTAGMALPSEPEYSDAVAEFMAYWLGRPGMRRTQHEWDHALIKSLKASRMRAKAQPPPPASPRAPTLTETRAATIAALTTGASDAHAQRQRRTELDITGESQRIG